MLQGRRARGLLLGLRWQPQTHMFGRCQVIIFSTSVVKAPGCWEASDRREGGEGSRVWLEQDVSYITPPEPAAAGVKLNTSVFHGVAAVQKVI